MLHAPLHTVVFVNASICKEQASDLQEKYDAKFILWHIVSDCGIIKKLNEKYKFLTINKYIILFGADSV